MRRRKLGSIEREILYDLTKGDLLYGFLLSGRSTSRMYKLARERANYRYRRRQAINRLVSLGLVRTQNKRLFITAAGRNAVEEAVRATAALLGVKAWDHKWRIVAFDIPERYAVSRAKVRGILKRAGFVKLQQSVWVFPHECKELSTLIKEESGLSQYILYGVLESIEGEGFLKKHFKL